MFLLDNQQQSANAILLWSDRQLRMQQGEMG